VAALGHILSPARVNRVTDRSRRCGVPAL